MKTFHFILYTVALLMFIACEKPRNEEPVPDTREDSRTLSIDISINNTGNGEITASFMPDNDSLRYYCSIISVEEYRANDGDAYVVERDMTIIEYIADKENISVYEYLETSLAKGAYTYTFTNLKGNEDYYVCAYEMDADGNAGVRIFKEEVKTGERFYEAYKFYFEVLNLGQDNIDIRLTPETNDSNYLYFFIDGTTFKSIGGEDGLGTYANEYIKFYAERYDMTNEEVTAIMKHTGECTFRHSGLLPKTEYYAIAVMTDEKGKLISNMSFQKFNTDEIDYLDVSFKVVIEEIGSDFVKGKVTPSESTPYLLTFITEDDYLSFESDETLMMAIIESHGMYLAWQLIYEEFSFTLEELDAESTYYAIVFGADYDTGLYTTRMTAVEFTTASEVIPEDVVFDINFREQTAFSVIVDYSPSNQNVDYFCDVIDRDMYEQTYGGTPEGLSDYMSDVFDVLLEQYPDMDVPSIVEALKQRGNFTYQFNFLQPEKQYYAWATVIDKSGEFVGEVTMKEFISMPFEQSEISVGISIDAYYDGSELAELDPYEYGSLNGYAVIPATFEPEEGAIHWYVRAYDGDLSGGSISDSELISDLVINGTADSCELNYMLPWDRNVTFCAVAVDQDNKFGKVNRKVIKFTKDGVSPAEDFISNAGQASKSAILTKSVTGHLLDGKIPESRHVSIPGEAMSLTILKDNK